MSSSRNPLSLSLADVARLLSKTADKPITVEMIQEAIEAGMPVDRNGNINLVHAAAWLNREMP